MKAPICHDRHTFVLAKFATGVHQIVCHDSSYSSSDAAAADASLQG